MATGFRKTDVDGCHSCVTSMFTQIYAHGHLSDECLTGFFGPESSQTVGMTGSLFQHLTLTKLSILIR